MSQATVADDVQTSRCKGTVGCADEKGGEGGGATGVEVDVLDFGEASDDVEDLGREEDGDGGADEDVGEDGGEDHAVGVGIRVAFSVGCSWHSRLAAWRRGQQLLESELERECDSGQENLARLVIDW